MFETLESRRLFAGGGQTLVINGTAGPDTIAFTQTANEIVVTLNGVTTHYARTWVIPSPNWWTPPSYGFLSSISVNGGDSNDTIKSDATVTLPETVIGGNGTDSIVGGSGNDIIYAGLGPFAPASDYGYCEWADGAAGNDRLYTAVTGMAQTLNGGVGSDSLYGTSGNNELRGGADNDVISTNGVIGGKIYGEGGNDILLATSASVRLDGGDGNDTLSVAFGVGSTYSTLNGGAGNDTITGAGNDIIDGGLDNDVINDKRGGGTIYGGYGNDNISVDASSTQNNWIDAGGGNDTVTTANGKDTIIGGDGNDLLNAGANNNTLFGTGGNDTLSAGTSADLYYGGDGFDYVSYAGRPTAVTATLDGLANDGTPAVPPTGANPGTPAENDYIIGDVEGVIGSSADDTITGSFSSNKIFGGPGNDIIRGGNGYDSVYGESGNDTLYGDNGDDLLSGHLGNDVLYGGMGTNALYGGEGNDTLVAIGGDGNDFSYGQNGLDSFWCDEISDSTDADAAELQGQRVHKVASFINTPLKNPTAPDLDDPKCDPKKGAYTNNFVFDNRKLFPSTGPVVNDIRQGMVGDCYYVATLGAIANASPDRIKESIVDMGDHTFAVRFYKDGSPVYVRVDDDIPVTLNANSIYAGSGTEGCIWAAMLEKAFVIKEAGVNGNYEDVSGGFPQDVFPMFNLTTEQWGHWYSAASFQEISNALAAGKAVTAVTDWTFSDFKFGDHIVESHVYSVISVDLFANTITLRNPWGTDAGGTANGGWVQGNDDGYITITLQEWKDNFGSSYGAAV